MGTGLGVDPTKSGSTITSGMSSTDHRKILGGLYPSPGVIRGCEVTTSTQSLTYTVAEGVAAIRTASSPNQIVLAPIPGGTVTTSIPGSGSRTDIVYARQNFPADGDSEVVLGVATTLPPNSVELMRFTARSTDTVTNGFIRSGSVNYVVPYGASLGVLYEYPLTYSGLLPDDVVRRGQGTIYLPTDRRVRFTITAVLFADQASKFDAARYCEYFFLPNIDGGDMLIWTTPGLHQAWATYTWSHEVNVLAGQHTVNYGMGRMSGPGHAATWYGVDPNAYGRTGINFKVEDAGVIR